jgi:hypothetical protein
VVQHVCLAGLVRKSGKRGGAAAANATVLAMAKGTSSIESAGGA